MFAAMRARVLMTACLLFGCNDLEEFQTDPGEAYIGAVIGTEETEGCEDAGDYPCSFIRRGFTSRTQLELTFDPNEVGGSPGTLTTVGELCGPTFDETPLRAITALTHDQLSLYDFPGGGRVRNYIFIARPETGPLAARDAMVFLSLLRGGRVEVRVIAGTGNAPCDPSDCDAFNAGGCDFFGVFDLRNRTSVSP